MAHGLGSRPNTVDVSVAMDSPSFVPGSRVTAIITIRSELSATPVKQDVHSVSSSRHSSPQLNSASSSPAGSATLRGLGADEYALVDYVVCEVAGRWTTDRAWVAPNAHCPVTTDSLDLHARPPLPAQKAAIGGPPNFADAAPPARERRAWDAALDDANKIGGGGRLGYSGVIFRSQTLVVCEREQVPVGSQTSFAVQCVLPDEIPPTLRGTAVRYSYGLVVVVGLPGSRAPKSVRVPFRVVLARAAPTSPDSTHTVAVPTPVTTGPMWNSFLERVRTRALSMSARLLKSTPPDDIEVALALSLNGRLTPYAADDEPWRTSSALDDDALSFVRDTPPAISRAASELADVVDGSDDIDNHASPGSTRARQPIKRNAVPVYAITRGKDSIARMYLPKRKLLLGDNITAVFYFDTDKPCLQLGARLEMHEVVKPKHSLGTKQDVASTKGTIFRKVYGEHGEFVMMNRNTHVTFSIPYDAPASFATDVVEIRWLIHFVFLIPQQPRKLRASPLSPMTTGHLAESTVLDDHEATRLLGDLEIQPDDSSDEEVPGWSGGAWAGEDPATFKAIPRGKVGDVEVLRWSLPLRVSGSPSPNSQWGTRSTRSLRLETSCK